MFFSRFNRSDSGLTSRETPFERDFLDSIRLGRLDLIVGQTRDGTRRAELLKNWEFVKRCAKEAAHVDNPEVVRSVWLNWQ